MILIVLISVLIWVTGSFTLMVFKLNTINNRIDIVEEGVIQEIYKEFIKNPKWFLFANHDQLEKMIKDLREEQHHFQNQIQFGIRDMP